mmetsp:Transcript_12721/g.15490  ORF Transcript_12721/g.15490 Transcript_12721/m.15490 type:complete len:347 (+) Transcript_12721:103-1143(+)
MPSTSDNEEIIRVMEMQERTGYKCNDYIEQQQQQLNAQSQYSSVSSSASSSSSNAGVNEIWREKICEWSYQVVDHFDINREVVAVSLSYLDRYLSTKRVNKKIFQLAAMTTLYLAMKLYSKKSQPIGSLIELSRGYFEKDHVEKMEQSIFRELSWRLHPPIALSMVKHLMIELPPLPGQVEGERRLKHDITEVSRFLTELSVCDYFFVPRRPSAIAVAAILCAIEIQLDTESSSILSRLFLNSVNGLLPLYEVSYIEEIEECRQRLSHMYFDGAYDEQQGFSQEDDERKRHSDSPVCVTDFASGTSVSSSGFYADDNAEALDSSSGDAGSFGRCEELIEPQNQLIS